MKCEAKIYYNAHDDNQTKSHYLCGRSVTSQIEYLDKYRIQNVILVCGTHLKKLQREAENQGVEITVTDAK